MNHVEENDDDAICKLEENNRLVELLLYGRHA